MLKKVLKLTFDILGFEQKANWEQKKFSLHIKENSKLILGNLRKVTTTASKFFWPVTIKMTTDPI